MFGGMQPEPSSQFQWGTAGWVDDGGQHLDLADTGNDGSNLVRVTLFSGRTPTTTPDQTQAQGSPILCRLADHVAMPQRGELVVVAIPAPFGKIPGSAVIIGKCSNNPSAQANLGAGEMVLQVPGSPAQIMLRQNGTIVLRTADANGNTSILKFGPQFFQIIDPAYMITCDTSGIRIRHSTGPEIVLSAITGVPSPLSALGAYIQLTAPIIKVDAPMTMLGPDLGGAAVYQPVVFSPDPSDVGGIPVTVKGISSAGVKVSIP